MHSALFLPEVDMAAPPTPTGSFGGFWRGSELGEPPTPASTSEVVKSKCHPVPCRHLGVYKQVWGRIHSGSPCSPGALVGPEAH